RVVYTLSLHDALPIYIVIGTGDSCELHLYHGDRRWHVDDGVIDDEDRRRQTIVSNLPAGSVYTTVLEERTHGRLYLPSAPGASRSEEHTSELQSRENL